MYLVFQHEHLALINGLNANLDIAKVDNPVEGNMNAF
jgi:hypothetical protein